MKAMLKSIKIKFLGAGVRMLIDGFLQRTNVKKEKSNIELNSEEHNMVWPEKIRCQTTNVNKKKSVSQPQYKFDARIRKGRHAPQDCSCEHKPLVWTLFN